MMTQIDNIELIEAEVSKVLTGGSFDKFCYSGIYTIVFNLDKEHYGFGICNLDVATNILIREQGSLDFNTDFVISDFFKIWSKTIVDVKIDKKLALHLYFDNRFECCIESFLTDPENLFDLRWELYQERNIESFCVRVSDTENIFLQMP